MNKKVIVKGALMFGLLGLLSTTAVADDKANAAGLCYQISGGTFSRFGGTIQNTSTSSELNVQCPVVRDNPGGAFVFNSIAFDVFDRHSSLNVSCSMCNEVAVSNGLTTNCGSPAQSSGDSLGVQKVFVPSNPTNLGGEQYSYASCSVPRQESGVNSHVARIWYNE